VTTAERLRRTLAVTRLTQIAVARRELDVHTSAVAVPVFGAGGAVVAALELEARDPQDLRRMQPPLVVAGRGLSRELAMSHPKGHFSLVAGRDLGALVPCREAVGEEPVRRQRLA